MNETNPNNKRTFDQLPADGQPILFWINKRPFVGVYSDEYNAVEITPPCLMDISTLVELNAVWITGQESYEAMRRALARLETAQTGKESR